MATLIIAAGLGATAVYVSRMQTKRMRVFERKRREGRIKDRTELSQHAKRWADAGVEDAETKGESQDRLEHNKFVQLAGVPINWLIQFQSWKWLPRYNEPGDALKDKAPTTFTGKPEKAEVFAKHRGVPRKPLATGPIFSSRRLINE